MKRLIVVAALLVGCVSTPVANGSIHIFNGYDDPAQAVVLRPTDPDNGTPVVTVFLMGGDSKDVQLPRGNYRVELYSVGAHQAYVTDDGRHIPAGTQPVLLGSRDCQAQ